MIKGTIDFLLGNSYEAKILRKKCVFKIIPMLNPDGVVYGNSRCSLLGVDLNRRWKHPNQHLHPTVYYTKKMLQIFAEEREIIMFCDLHGHSIKKNAFMYACSYLRPNASRLKKNIFLRLIPYLLSKENHFFSYENSHFRMEKSKQATARIVSFKEFKILASYTLEASFGGSDKKNTDKKEHQFDEKELESIGKDLGKILTTFFSNRELKIKMEELSNFLMKNSGKIIKNVSRKNITKSPKNEEIIEKSQEIIEKNHEIAEKNDKLKEITKKIEDKTIKNEFIIEINHEKEIDNKIPFEIDESELKPKENFTPQIEEKKIIKLEGTRISPKGNNKLQKIEDKMSKIMIISNSLKEDRSVFNSNRAESIENAESFENFSIKSALKVLHYENISNIYLPEESSDSGGSDSQASVNDEKKIKFILSKKKPSKKKTIIDSVVNKNHASQNSSFSQVRSSCLTPEIPVKNRQKSRISLRKKSELLYKSIIPARINVRSPFLEENIDEFRENRSGNTSAAVIRTQISKEIVIPRPSARIGDFNVYSSLEERNLFEKPYLKVKKK